MVGRRGFLKFIAGGAFAGISAGGLSLLQKKALESVDENKTAIFKEDGSTTPETIPLALRKMMDEFGIKKLDTGKKLYEAYQDSIAENTAYAAAFGSATDSVLRETTDLKFTRRFGATLVGGAAAYTPFRSEFNLLNQKLADPTILQSEYGLDEENAKKFAHFYNDDMHQRFALVGILAQTVAPVLHGIKDNILPDDKNHTPQV